jgi:hypothetical protein
MESGSDLKVTGHGNICSRMRLPEGAEESIDRCRDVAWLEVVSGVVSLLGRNDVHTYFTAAQVVFCPDWL